MENRRWIYCSSFTCSLASHSGLFVKEFQMFEIQTRVVFDRLMAPWTNMRELIKAVNKYLRRGCHCFPDSDKRFSLQLSAPREDDCTQARPALAPHTDLPPVILCTWKALASLWMASVNAADRGITSSHNFWLPMADACCQTVEELLSFVTFSCGCQRPGARPAPPQTSGSHRSLCGPSLPAADHLSAELRRQVFNLQPRSCHLYAFDEFSFSHTVLTLFVLWFCFRNPSPTLRNPEEWCKSFCYFIGQ